jgi:transposase InsO family protein
LLGKTRQSYYQREKYIYKKQVKASILKEMVEEIRKEQPKLGGRKLLEMPRLKESMDIGRDAFFDFLRENKLLVRKTKKRAITTDSRHWLHKYPNLIKEFIPTSAHQLWVSDITYLETKENGFVYLFLITDAYSRKIIGWHLSETMDAENALKALYMALKILPAEGNNLIHHSDRGVQYCCHKYVNLLKKANIKISMTANGDPLENAIAERVNGILKTEWLYHKALKNKHEAYSEIAKIVNIYNEKRPHSSLDMLTPEQAHKRNGELKKRWKNYKRIKYEEYLKKKNEKLSLEIPEKAMVKL